MKKQIFGSIVLFSSMFLMTGFLSFSGQAYSKSQQTVLVFGDSLSAAYNIDVSSGWVSLLQNFLRQQGLDVEVVNASISGETTTGGLARLEEQLKRYQPQIVILELGGNDGLRGFPLEVTESNLEQMVSMILSSNAEVLLAGIKIPPNYGRTYTKRFEAIYSKLGQQQKVHLIPFILSPIENRLDLLQADGIHPKAEAQPLIQAHVGKYLTPLLNTK